MAIIGKIRDKGWLVLVFVGLALLAFIFTDWSRITQGNELKFGYGTIYGEMVDADAFEDAVTIAQKNADDAAARQGQQSQPVDRDQVWKSYIEDLLLEREFEALGIDVSPAEFDAYLYGNDGFDVMPDLASTFVDSTNTFNPKLLQARIEQMEDSDDATERESWEQTKEYYIKKRKAEKYFDILGQGMYATKLEAKNDYLAQQTIKNVSYVLKRYREIPDEDIATGDKALKAFFEANKTDKKYSNRVAARKIHFFDIMIEPSKEDSTRFNNEMDKLKSGFASTSNDSSYVIKNSELKFYTSGAYATALPKTHANAKQHLNYPKFMDTVFQKSQVGDIVGPYEQEGVQTLAKVIGFTSDTINARHILLKAEPGKEAEMETFADSLMEVINDGNFVEYVQKYSQDPGSKEKDGDLGDFFFSTMVQPFAMFCADKPIGEIGKVRSQFGIHIVQVTDRRGPKYPRLAVIQKTLKPSQQTLDERQDIAYELLYDIGDKIDKKKTAAEKVAVFDTVAKRNGYFARPIVIQDNAPNLYGFTSAFAEDKILKLAFREAAEEGDLVDSPIQDKNKHVIAILVSIMEKGEPKFDDVRDDIKRAYIEEKKAEKLEKTMKGKALKNIQGASVAEAEITFGNPQITGAGYEPEVVGAIFSQISDGSRTRPIRGKAGVYVVQVDKTVKAPTAANYDAEKAKLVSGYRSSLSSDAKRALNKRADVVDNRRLFRQQIRR